jgi:hypothetical protein
VDRCATCPNTVTYGNTNSNPDLNTHADPYPYIFANPDLNTHADPVDIPNPNSNPNQSVA